MKHENSAGNPFSVVRAGNRTPPSGEWEKVVVAGFFVALALYKQESSARLRASAVSSPVAVAKGGVVETPDTFARIVQPATNGPAPAAQPTPRDAGVAVATPVPAVVEAPPSRPVATPPSIAPATPEAAAGPRPEATAAAAQPPTEAKRPGGAGVSFKQDVMPILQKNCAACHGALGRYSVKDYASVVGTGINKPLIIAGKPQESKFVKRLEEKPSMPPGGPLPAADIEKIKQWIAEGAKDN